MELSLGVYEAEGRLHYGLTERQSEEILKHWSFGEERLLHDTFYSVGDISGTDQMWLRRRRDVDAKSEPEYVLTESRRVIDNPLLHINRYFGLDAIEKRLEYCKGVIFDKERPIEEQFPMFYKGRFYRREVECPMMGKIRLDETMYGILLGITIMTPKQLETVTEFANGMGLTPGYSKLTAFDKKGPISVHLYGYRCDILMDEDTEDSDNEEWMREWRAEAAALAVILPEGNHQFEYETPDVAYARRIFGEICGPNSEK